MIKRNPSRPGRLPPSRRIMMSSDSLMGLECSDPVSDLSFVARVWNQTIPTSPRALRPGSSMSAQMPAHALDAVAQKWRDIAERRRAHFLELYASGRWKHYYSEEQFLYRMREAIRLSERWAEIAPPPPDEVAAEHAQPPDASHRTAA